VELNGTTAQTEVVLTNRSGVPANVDLTAGDKAQALAFEFAGGPRVRVPAGQILRVPVRITCPDRTRLVPSPAITGFTVTATPVDPAGESRSVQGELTLPAAADVRLRLEPEWVQWSGGEAWTNASVSNRSGRPVTVSLEAYDRAKILAFEFAGGNRPTIPPGQTLDVRLRIACADTARLASGGTAFTVTATPLEPPGEPSAAPGELVLPGPPDFRLWLEPERVTGNGAERVRLVVENASHRAAVFAVSARSRDEGLTVRVETERVEVAARGQGSVQILLTPRDDGSSPGVGAEAQVHGFVARVAPVDAPTAGNEVSGSYVVTPARISMRLHPKEIEAAGATAFEVRVDNGGDSAATVELEAADRTGMCTFTFDPPRLSIPRRSSARARLVVTPPGKHTIDARWSFEVTARPVSPSGAPVRDEGVLIYHPPVLNLSIVPPERRHHRAARFSVVVRNPTPVPVTMQLSASGDAGLEMRLHDGRAVDPIAVPPNGAVELPLLVTPRSRPGVRDEWTARFVVTATPVSPPGTALTAEGRFVTLPPRRFPSLRWALLLVLVALLALAVGTDTIRRDEAALLAVPLAGGLVLRSWRWAAVCVAVFAAFVAALSIDGSVADVLHLSTNRNLDQVLGIAEGDLVDDVRQALPPDDRGERDGSVKDGLDRIGIRSEGSLDAHWRELLDAAVVIAVCAAAGTIAGKGAGFIVRRART
jgi:hypothetical protein